MTLKSPTVDEIESCRDHRFQNIRLESHEAYLASLRFARRVRDNAGLDCSALDAALKQAEDELGVMITTTANDRIYPRKRAKVNSNKTCVVYLDECGSHSFSAKESFRAFCLAAIIIRDEDRDAFEAKWRTWKGQNIGSETAGVHEPAVRSRGGRFYKENPERQEALLASLGRVIGELDFTGVACVLVRDKYVEKYGSGRMDSSLPKHGYLMALDFVVERIALALQNHFGGAKAHLIIESRGPAEDAWMQYEFARLFLDGTTYLHPGYFRRQFLPGLEFRSKDDRLAGLEIADLLARPCAEKALDPSSTPERWLEFRPKLCDGQGETKHSILGLKIVPWDDCYRDLWKS